MTSNQDWKSVLYDLTQTDPDAPSDVLVDAAIKLTDLKNYKYWLAAPQACRNDIAAYVHACLMIVDVRVPNRKNLQAGYANLCLFLGASSTLIGTKPGSSKKDCLITRQLQLMEWATPAKELTPLVTPKIEIPPMVPPTSKVDEQPTTFVPDGPKTARDKLTAADKVRIAVVCSPARSKQIKIWAHGIIELEIDFYDKGRIEKANRSEDTYKLVLIDRSSINRSTHNSALLAFEQATRVEEKLTRNKFVDVVCRLIY